MNDTRHSEGCFEDIPMTSAIKIFFGAIALLIIVTAAASCGGPLKNQPVCSESRDTRCLTPMKCEYDAQRRCEVCVCDSPAYVPLDK